MKRVLFLLAFLVLVQGHGVLVCPPPRTGQNILPGNKLYPEPPTPTETNGCDISVLGPIQATYAAGSTIQVTWDTTILHTSYPGVRIAVSYSSTDSFNNNVLANGTDIGNSGLNTISVTLPAGKTCTTCQIQWIWASQQDMGYYLGCSDIAIVAAGGQTNIPVCPNPTANVPAATVTSNIIYGSASVAVPSLMLLLLLAILF